MPATLTSPTAGGIIAAARDGLNLTEAAAA